MLSRWIEATERAREGRGAEAGARAEAAIDACPRGALVAVDGAEARAFRAAAAKVATRGANFRTIPGSPLARARYVSLVLMGKDLSMKCRAFGRVRFCRVIDRGVLKRRRGDARALVENAIVE
jgi:hypothetical protein